MSSDSFNRSNVEIETSIHDGNVPISTELMRSLAADLKYNQNQTVDKILQDIDGIRKFDAVHEEHEREAAKHGLIGAAVMMGGIGICVGGGLVGDTLGTGIIVVGAICAFAGFVYMVMSIITKFKNAKFNLDDKRYECLGGLLKLLSADTAKDANVAAAIDFGNDIRDDLLLRIGKVGPWEVKYYESAWFSLTGQLLDGTKYSISIKEKIQQRSKSKISASGKHKVKHKSKSGEEISLRVRVKAKRYPNLADVAADAQAAVQLPNYAAVKSFKFDATDIALTVSIRDELSQQHNLWRSVKSNAPEKVAEQVNERVQLIAMMMLSVYQVLNKTKVVQ